VAEQGDVTGPLPRVPRDAVEIRRRGEVVLDRVAARSRADLHTRLARLRIAAPLIAQSALAAGASWYLAEQIDTGPGTPFFAPVAAVISLGAALGQRLRRSLELVVGVALGVGIGDLLIETIGTGTGQLVLIVALAMSLAILLDGGQILVLQATTSSVLVATLVPASGHEAGLDRFRDALIGGTVGVVVGLLLLPLNPLAVAKRAVVPVTLGLSRGLELTAAALRAADTDAALAALDELRAMEAKVATMNTAVATSAEIARIAPMRWRTRERFGAFAEGAPQLDYAVRNARVLARRVTVLLRAQHYAAVELPGAIALLAEAALAVGREIGEPTQPRECRRLLVEAFAQARAVPGPDTPTTVLVLVAQVRSIVYDLLRATGLNRVDALALLDG
jgi:uncharacterized membrane protein YgaE (UPF0421/DUF939 family)